MHRYKAPLHAHTRRKCLRPKWLYMVTRIGRKRAGARLVSQAIPFAEGVACEARARLDTTILYHNITLISLTHIVIFTATFHSKPLYGIIQCIAIIESLYT